MSKENITWHTVTSEQMQVRFENQLDNTPKWRVLKRRQLKVMVRFWGKFDD